MNRLFRILLSLVASSSLCGCYSLIVAREERFYYSRDAVDVLYIAGMHSEGWSHDPSVANAGVAIGVLIVYPLDVLGSIMTSIEAGFCDDLDIRGGVPGALAGVFLPFLSAWHLRLPPRRVELEEGEMALLIEFLEKRVPVGAIAGMLGLETVDEVWRMPAAKFVWGRVEVPSSGADHWIRVDLNSSVELPSRR